MDTTPGAIRRVSVERYCNHDYDRTDILGHDVGREWCEGTVERVIDIDYGAAAACFVEIVFGFDGDGGQHVGPRDFANVRAILDAALGAHSE